MDEDTQARVDRAVALYRITAIQYYRAYETMAPEDGAYLREFALAYVINSLARAESLLATVAVRRTQTRWLADAIVDALRRYDDEQEEPNDR
jgi:hypothetical protein